MDIQRVHDWMLSQYNRWRCLLPTNLLYHADHLRIRRLLCAPAEVQAAAIEHQLRHVLANAIAHVRFYRNHVKLNQHELANEDPVALLERFPYICKAEVMANQRDFLDERRDSRLLRYATSHGSSGQGIGVWRDKRQADIEKAFYAHEWGKLGFCFHKSRYLRIGCDASRPLDQGPVWTQGNRLMLSPEHLAARHKRTIAEAVNRFQPRYIHAYPSLALALADMAQAGEFDFALDAVLLASEPASTAQLSSISQAFRCPVSISYGLTERTNLAFADHRAGTTGAYRFEHLYGKTETRMLDDQHEIVGTSLWNDLMPLIRYRTGDFAKIDGAGQCAMIDGRLQEFVLDRDGNRIPGLAIALEASTWDFVRECQIRQRRPGEITLVVVPRQARLSAKQKAALQARPRQCWGSRIAIDVCEASEIPQQPGTKRRFVVSDLPPRPSLE